MSEGGHGDAGLRARRGHLPFLFGNYEAKLPPAMAAAQAAVRK